MTGRARVNRVPYHEDDLVRRGDVIDSITGAMLAARGKRDDGYEDACLDILDALTGYCHPSHAIQAKEAAR
jgi:hypothetical protein